ncbi:Eco57I restriction-modification methylase domain-containing protein [Ligilactobacillus equi]|uniref:site-specific DNA-methyltransferase (adenine-specific) n=1 Tax=Ligilactobacillus equi DSM 15833 = JCM 10991 TaxID=1423740 RepID=A0A0R1TLG2_9LACO|nr:N-6 DNA methylase [Ligilactobacillus equi]KRL78235.1 hypothetical protein FC36_GL001121 [Ligilactobacillus equi DSM 15833 = JCM 10991]
MILTQEKKNGIQYTPDDLSLFIAQQLKYYFLRENSDSVSNQKLKLLDPACGDGNLLLAVQNVFKDIDYQGYGIDIDQKAIHIAEGKLNHNNFKLFSADYLSLIENVENVNLFNQPNSLNNEINNIDLIIANPPYIRTSILGAERSQHLAKLFNLSGKVDMYHVFLKAMTNTLKDNGILCVITSNKYLTNKSGKNIRDFLSDNFKILNIIDLGDTKPFSAAVLPAIFIGKKKKHSDNSSVPFTRVYESASSAKSTDSIDKLSTLLKEKNGIHSYKGHSFKVTSGLLDASVSDTPWNMATFAEKEWVTKLEKNAHKKFGDVFDVHVGIKTTADNVFIKKNWKDLDTNIRPEKEVLHPLVSSKTIERWQTHPDNLNTILYTHTIKNGKRIPIDFYKYPHAYNYLLEHKQQLAGRSYIKKAKRKWYEIWVPQQPEQLANNKVIFPDISQQAKFVYDDKGYYVDGNCYWLTTKNDVSNNYLLLATGVANSSIMEKYYNIKFQNVLYSGRKRYLTQYVKNYLLPDINNKHSQKIIKLVKMICKNPNDTKKLEKSINSEVQLAFNMQ